MDAVDLFWNGRTRRPRLPWRLVLAVVVLVAVSLALNRALAGAIDVLADPVVGVLTPTLSGAEARTVVRGLLSLVGQAVVILLVVSLVGRVVDRRWLRDYGFALDRTWWLDLGAGLAIGAVLMTGVFLLELALGWIRITGTLVIGQADFAVWPWIGWSLLTYVGVGVVEEFLFRGYLLTNVAEGLTWFDRVGRREAVGIATLGTSLLFGLAHATNPSASLASTLGILVGALMLAAGYVITGELAIPIGIHVTWNFVQGTVYGFPVSGTTHGVSILGIEQAGPTLLTGGAFGPEAGLVGVLAAIAGIGLVVAWVHQTAGEVHIDPQVTTPALRTASDSGAQPDGDGPQQSAPDADRY